MKQLAEIAGESKLDEQARNNCLAFMSDGMIIQDRLVLAMAGRDTWNEKWQAALENWTVRMENMLDRIAQD